MYDWPGNGYGNEDGNTPYASPSGTGLLGVNLNADATHDLYSDYGGIALSTVTVINITARVEEQLTFCVTGSNPSAWATFDCSDPVVTADPPAVALGSLSGTNRVLSPQRVDSNPVSGTNTPIWSQLSTNATHGAVIDMRNSNLNDSTPCGGLSANGTTCGIPAISQNAADVSGPSPWLMGIGQTDNAAFGLFVSTSSIYSGSGGVGTITPSSTYYNAACAAADPTNPLGTGTCYGMDQSTTGNNVISEFGSTLASTTGPVYRVDTNYVFAATAGLTTPAGIYSANLSMIATGTF
jgi:hypothetical protein